MGIYLFDDALTSGSAMVSKTYSPCAISEVGEEKSSSRLGILAQQEILKRVQDDKEYSLSHKGRGKVSSKHAAFTLAEVLITLGIIGVVAAMTIPTLVQSYKKKVVETKLVKVVSMMNQAIKFSTIENGDVVTWKTLGNSNNTSATYDDILEWFNTYIGPYLKTQKFEKFQLNSKDYLKVYLMDGTALIFAPYIYDVTYVLDEKGMDFESNEAGIHRFLFQLRFKLPDGFENNQGFLHALNSGFAPYAYNWDGTYEGAKHAAEGYGCYDTEGVGPGALCTKLIELNGWKIPDDYPYKF